MVVATYPEKHVSLKDSEVFGGDLVLRICNSARRGQLVRLKSPKCTIGSSPHCTMRLHAGDIAPVHCLILRGPRAAVVRCWAPDTRLNQQTFTDAPLTSGDRLSIGPIDLEVVSIGRPEMPVETAREISPPNKTPDLQAEWNARLDSATKALEEDRRRLDQLAATLDERQKAISTEIELLDAQRSEFEAEQRQWQSEQDEARRQLDAQREDFEARQKELKDRQQALAEDCRQWEDRHHDSIVESASQQETWNVRLAECEEQKERLDHERRQWESEKAERQQRLDTQYKAIQSQLEKITAEQAELRKKQEDFNAQEAEFQNRQAAFETQQAQWEAEKKAIEAQRADFETEREAFEAQRAELDAEKAAIETQRVELESEKIALAEQREAWETRQAEQASLSVVRREEAEQEEVVVEDAAPVEPQYETPSEKAPVDLADIFRRVGAKVDLEEDEEEERPARSVEGEAASLREMKPATPTAASKKPASAESENEEESIDSYMKRLMQRVAPGSTAKTSAYMPTAPRQEPVAVSTPAPSTADPLPRIQEGKLQPGGLTAPRTVAPETPTDLSALRALANLSAQAALGRHSRNVLLHAMRSKLVVAVVSLITGIALLWLWMTFSAPQMTFYTALFALLVTIYWGVEYALLTGRLIVSKSGHLDVDWTSLPFAKKTAPSDTASEDVSTEEIADDLDGDIGMIPAPPGESQGQ